MTALDPSLVMRVPGRLCISPTQLGLDGAFPHGGTALGFFENFEWCVDEEIGHVFSEYLSKNVAVVRGATTFRAEFDMTQFDVSAFTNSNVRVYGLTGATDLIAPRVGNICSPGLQAAHSPILFAPNDPVNHPGILILNPTWTHGRSKRVPQNMDDLRRESFTIHANEDSTARVFVCDYLRNMSLT